MPRDTAVASGALVHYEQARVALARCSRVDEAASIRDKAAKLAAYARMRDDAELEIWVSEIKLRACGRIGELSRALDKSEQSSGGRHPNGGKPTKTQTLADAGISTSTAGRYEELAGGPTVNGHKAAEAATDRYFAEQRTARKAPTMNGLRDAVRNARDLVEPASNDRRAPGPSPEYRAWLAWSSAVKEMASNEVPDFAAIAAQAERLKLVRTMWNEADEARVRLQFWLEALEKRKPE